MDLGLRAWDANGYIAPGAKATVYLTGTSTLINVFSDVNGSVAVANPIVADGDGYWPQRFVTQAAKVVITDADDATLLTLDPAPVSLGTGSGASDISFEPTVEVPETNVQAAIEAISASVVSGFSEFGVGITGNATLLANIDTQTTGAGDYRFDGTTLGTFPTGLVAADTGKVNIERQASNAMDMEIGAATGHRVWRRRLVAGTWGPWRDVVSVPTSALANGDIITRASGEWARLGIGPAGTAARSTGTALVYSEGTRVLLASKTGAGASIDFTETNNAVYRFYEFELQDVKPVSDSVALFVRFSTTGGATYDSAAANYAYAVVGRNSAGSAITDDSAGATEILLTNAAVGNDTSEFGVSGTVKVFNAAVSGSRTRVIASLSYDSLAGNTAVIQSVGRRLAEQDTDAFRFNFSGQIASGTIRMYGLT